MNGVWSVSKPLADILCPALCCAISRKEIVMNKFFYSLVALCGLVVVLGGCAGTREVWLVDGVEMNVEEFAAYRLEHPYTPPPVVKVERPAPPESSPPMYRWADGSVHDAPEVSIAAEYAKMAALPDNSPGVKSDDWAVQANQTSAPVGELVYLGSGSSPTPPPGIGGGQYQHVIAVPRGTAMMRGVRFAQPTQIALVGGGGGHYHFYGTNHDYWGPGWGGGYSYFSQAHIGVGGGISIESGLNNPDYRNRTFPWSYRQQNDNCDNGPRSNSGMRRYGPIYK